MRKRYDVNEYTNEVSIYFTESISENSLDAFVNRLVNFRNSVKDELVWLAERYKIVIGQPGDGIWTYIMNGEVHCQSSNHNCGDGTKEELERILGILDARKYDRW